MATYEEITIKKATEALVGKTVADIRFLTEEEAQELFIDKRSIVIFFNDGSHIFPMRDPEGNDAGTLFTSIDGLEIIGSIN